MKVKSSIKMSGINISVKLLKKIALEDDEEAMGHAHEAMASIKLATHFEGNPIPECVRAATFFHEILHQACWIAGVGLEEEEVTALSNVLFQTLRDNHLHFDCKS